MYGHEAEVAGGGGRTMAMSGWARSGARSNGRVVVLDTV